MQEDIDFGGLKKRIKQLKATTLLSMRNRALMAAIAAYGKKEVVALWGRDARSTGRGKKDDINLSFGQEHSQDGYDLFMKGMYTAAEEELALAVNLDRRFGCALNNLGVALLKQGKLEEGRARLIDGTTSEPPPPSFSTNPAAPLFRS